MEDCIDVEQCRVEFKCDDDSLLPPIRSKTTSVGHVLSSTICTLLQPGDECDLLTGFSYMGVYAPHPVRHETDIHLSQCIAVVESRSQLFDKHRVYVRPKQVRQGLPIVVTLTNAGDRAVRIDVGDKIAQLVIVQHSEAHICIPLDIKEGKCVKGDCIPTETITLAETEWGRIEPYGDATHEVFNRIVTGNFRGRVHQLTPIGENGPVAQLAIRMTFLPGRVRVVRSDRSTRKDYRAVKNSKI